MGAIRKRPKGDPKKDQVNQKNRPMAHELQTGFQGLCHTETMGSGGKLPFPVVGGDLTATCNTIMGCRLVLYVSPYA